MSVPHVTAYPDGSLVFTVPYHRDWVEGVKAAVPAAFRSWDPASKTWTIRPPYGVDVLGLTRTLFGRVDAAGSARRDAPGPEVIRRADPHFAALHLLPTAPPAVVDAAYKALSRAAHPDLLPARERDRAHEAMVALNTAYDALRARGVA